MQKKIEKIFLRKLPMLRRQYSSSAVNALNNSPKILNITKRHFFRLNCLQKDH